MTQRLNPSALRRLATELSALHSNPPEGILVHINEEQITEIHATILGPPSTPYASGEFRVRLTISDDFPNTPPTGTFVTKIFHPNVSERGEICVNTLKRDWQKHYGIEHVLVTIKCLLIYPNPESALNAEAGKLLLEQYEDYATRARLMTEVHATLRNGERVDAENQDPKAKPKDTQRKKNLKRF
ncbi:ubiquitin-conjugating enzyme E2 S [Coemansia sp. RSA 518]|nr:ubiquitin-conjugating enzyme E2 S [Coemansia sp. RSA 522]KAJ2231729.1 ubiquitin-conjugating enzyme E2 S [Coemansia sp. RSA 518]KAJ2293527.1 ubiquitin-conjugating enzyme E2 S [Coemansia sp. RSA 355]KAJ2404310.1 ubiquitin-conjugating enzyme E2 S [Coemansia sp. RSA 2526]KAJ2722402.1 ubiquitin-conjugating enzyme E2 S [Coemansia sp. D1744]